MLLHFAPGFVKHHIVAVGVPLAVPVAVPVPVPVRVPEAVGLPVVEGVAVVVGIKNPNGAHETASHPL